jgi:hypothetical protein
MSQGHTSATVEFNGLILGFSSAALYYLGEVPLDGKQVGQVSLPLAKQNIDILMLLQTKTKGNLSDEESKLIKEILADLQIKFVSATKALA